MGKHYSPKTMRNIFATSRTSKFLEEVVFYEVNLRGEREWLPRWGSSPFTLDNQLFLFGGFYGREAGYLSMQNDISALDLSGFSPETFEPRKL